MMRQTGALLLDAYRQLNAKKLFWITLALSGLVVLIYAATGIDERGVTFLWFRLGFIPVTSDQIAPELLYKSLFLNLGVGVWLTWIATVLALVSTANVIPDFIASGSIELSLSKPISRARLFITKYATGLLFAGLQVAVFTGASFLVIGIRGKSWEPSLFLAIPLVVLFFSYLYCVSALLGLITRSTIAALLITILFWFVLFLLNTADQTLLLFKIQGEQQITKLTREYENQKLTTPALYLRQKRAEGADVADGYAPTIEEMEEVNPFMRGKREKLENTKRVVGQLDFWSGLTIGVKTALPKTQETIGLMERSLISMADLNILAGPEEETEPDEDTDSNDPLQGDQRELSLLTAEALRNRSWIWIVGTSLGFEVVILAIGSFIFARRDF